MGGASKAARRSQIVQAQAEKSDSAKKIQKIVRGKQGRKKAHAIPQFKENKKANNGRSEGGKKKVGKKNASNTNCNTKENNIELKYVGIHKKAHGGNDSAKTIQKFLRQASFRRRRRRQEAAGTLTLGQIS